MIKLNDPPAPPRAKPRASKSARLRLNGEARRENLIAAARSLFSERGFDGATTRELAERAHVSEALLFKHFKNKRAIYLAMLEDCMKSDAWSKGYRLLELKPCAATLAAMLHFVGEKVTAPDDDMRTSHRLLARSLSEDGEFARVIFQHVDETWVGKMNACLRAAKRAGELRAGFQPHACSGWLAQHVFMMLALAHTPNDCAVDYAAERTRLIRETVLFCLRGMGLSDSAIAAAYVPDAYALFSSESN
jgi:AcrR family transcriptional regulator